MKAEDSDRLTIKEYPILFWLMGAIFTAVGAGVTIGALESGEITILMGLLFLGIGLLFVLLIATITTISADRISGNLNIYSRSLLRRTSREIPINDLASVDIESSHSSDGNTYRISFRKKSGEMTPLHSYYSSGYGEKEKKARRISQFLGIPGPSDAITSLQAIGEALHPALEKLQEGESSGVHWIIETSTSGTVPVTRWSSQDFRFEGSSLLLTQIPQGAIVLPGSKWLGGVSAFLYKQVLRLYGFTEEDTQGLDGAKSYELPKPGLGEHFAAVTNDSYGAQQLLTPWAGNLLMDWVRRFPQRKNPSGELGMPAQLVVLFSPQKLYLVTSQTCTDELIQEMIRLGIGLVKEAGSA